MNPDLRPGLGRGEVIFSQQKHLVEQLEPLASRAHLQACLHYVRELGGIQGLSVTSITATAGEGNRRQASS